MIAHDWVGGVGETIISFLVSDISKGTSDSLIQSANSINEVTRIHCTHFLSAMEIFNLGFFAVLKSRILCSKGVSPS